MQDRAVVPHLLHSCCGIKVFGHFLLSVEEQRAELCEDRKSIGVLYIFFVAGSSLKWAIRSGWSNGSAPMLLRIAVSRLH